MKTVVIVDDHRFLAETVALELARREIAIGVVVDAEDPHAIPAIIAADPDACLIDLDLGHQLAAGMRFLRESVSLGLPTAMFTGSTDVAQLGRCLEEGAVGVVCKGLPLATVAAGVRHLVNNEPVNTDRELLSWMRAAQEQRKIRTRQLAPFDALTARERVVLQHLIEGLRADDIAELDFVTVATVRSQIRAVLQKLCVTSQLAAVAAAHRARWSDQLVSA